jgi:hypothetical protein
MCLAEVDFDWTVMSFARKSEKRTVPDSLVSHLGSSLCQTSVHTPSTPSLEDIECKKAFLTVQPG